MSNRFVDWIYGRRSELGVFRQDCRRNGILLIWRGFKLKHYLLNSDDIYVFHQTSMLNVCISSERGDQRVSVILGAVTYF